MMPDLTVMVPELEIDRKVSNINISKEKCDGDGMPVLTGVRGGYNKRSYYKDKNQEIKNHHLDSFPNACVWRC
jgi:hypothetical protein